MRPFEMSALDSAHSALRAVIAVVSDYESFRGYSEALADHNVKDGRNALRHPQNAVVQAKAAIEELQNFVAHSTVD